MSNYNNKRKYRTELSLRDEFVPEGYIPIYDLFTQEKYALPLCPKGEWCIGEKKLHSMRIETFRAVKKRYELCNAKNFAKFWNGNLDAINDLGINHFSAMTNFKELSTAMICFQETVPSKANGSMRKLVSWGIKDSIYREYYKSQLEALKTGEQPQKVNLYDQRKKRSGNLFKYAPVQLKFDDKDGVRILNIEENAVYRQFEHWCKIKGIEKKNALYQAMVLLMAEEPVTNGELKELDAYERKTDLDYTEILIPETSVNNYVSIFCKVPKSIHSKMCEIIKRFNSDVENIGKSDMSIEKYAIQGIDLLNKNVPLKYSDPSAYEDYIKAKEAKEFNERAIQR